MVAAINATITVSGGVQIRSKESKRIQSLFEIARCAPNENMLPQNYAKEYEKFFENDNTNKKTKRTTIFAFALLFLLTSIALCFSVISFAKSNKLENEVVALKTLLKSFKNIIDDDLYSDIKNFENEDTYTDESEFDEQTEGTVKDNDLFDSDFVINYDEVTRITDEVTYVDNSNDEEDLTEYLKGGQYTKEGKETARFRRDLATIYEGGRVNKTLHGRHHKNVPDGGDGVNSPIPKYAQSYSSPAWTSQHDLVSKNLKHYEEMGLGSTTQTPPVIVRNSRVMQFEQKTKPIRRVIKKSFLKTGEQENEDTTPRGRRNRHRTRPHFDSIEERHHRSRIRLLPSIQFSGDTSHYILGHHPNFKGDGHLRHPNRTYVDWKENDWVEVLGMNQHFILDNGLLTIKEPGLYFTYAQIFYSDRHDINGFVVYKNQFTPLLQCTTTTHSLDDVTKSNTCYTAGVEYFVRGDQVSLRDISFDRYSIFEPGKSFFGVVKLGDGRM